jgi:hypothetical protein
VHIATVLHVLLIDQKEKGGVREEGWEWEGVKYIADHVQYALLVK